MTPTRPTPSRPATAWAFAWVLAWGMGLPLCLATAVQAAPTRPPAAADSGALAAWETTAPDAVAAAPAAPPPWWMAFDDAALNLLVHSAQQRQAGLLALRPADAAEPAGARDAAVDQARRQVVAAYLGARVLSARWLAMNNLRNAADRQRQLLARDAGPNPSADAQTALAALQQRSDGAARQQQALALQREASLQTLAALCGLRADEMGDLLAPALAQSSVPAFGSAVPARLPKSILRARADVAAAEAAVLRSLRGGGNRQHTVLAQMQQADGWIAADGALAGTAARAIATLATPSAAAPAPELEELNALLDHAAQEVAQDLRSLAERARQQAERAQLADTNRLAFLAARDRLKTGEINELQVLEQYQRLLAETERYADACGELAMAWLRLVESTGASEQVLVRQ